MEDAIAKAEKFLENHHHTISLKSSENDNGVWCLIFDVGFLSAQLKKVKVDANSGKVVGYTDASFKDGDGD